MVVFIGLTSIVFAIWRAHEVSLVRAHIQEQTLLCITRITRELAETASATVQAEPDGLVFASPRDENSVGNQDPDDGRLLWQKFVAFYVQEVDGVAVVLRKEKLIPTGSRSPDPPSPAGGYSLASIKADDTLPARQIARDVGQLRCEQLGELVRLEIVVRKRYPRQNRDYEVLTNFGYTVRN